MRTVTAYDGPNHLGGGGGGLAVSGGKLFCSTASKGISLWQNGSSSARKGSVCSLPWWTPPPQTHAAPCCGPGGAAAQVRARDEREMRER